MQDEQFTPQFGLDLADSRGTPGAEAKGGKSRLIELTLYCDVEAIIEKAKLLQTWSLRHQFYRLKFPIC